MRSRGGVSKIPSTRHTGNLGSGSVTRQGMGGGNGGGGNNNNHFESVVGYERKKTAGDKISNSLSGLMLGPILIFIGCTLLWYNEKWAIKTYRSLHEALDAHVTLSLNDVSNTDTSSRFHNKLVHVMGDTTVDQPLTDTDFGLTRSNVIALERQVEIYQWTEKVTTHRKKLQNGETEVRESVDYTPRWVGEPVSSDGFRHLAGHENVGSLPISSAKVTADAVHLGKHLVLSETLTRKIKTRRDIRVGDIPTLPAGAVKQNGNYVGWPIKTRGGAAQQQALPEAGIEKTFTRVDGEERTMYTVKATGDQFSSKERALEEASKHVSVASPQHQQQVSPSSSPEIGDVRVSFSEIPCTYVSVLAQMTPNNMLTSWISSQGRDYDVAMLSEGAVGARDMIESAQSDNSIKTWLFRGLGWLLNFIGFSLVTNIISTTADVTLNWIPFLGPMANSIINLGLTIANTILASSTTLIVASIAWVVYRPILGVSLLIGSLGLFFMSARAGTSGRSFKAS